MFFNSVVVIVGDRRGVEILGGRNNYGREKKG